MVHSSLHPYYALARRAFGVDFLRRQRGERHCERESSYQKASHILDLLSFCPTSPAAALSSGPGCLFTALLALPETDGIPKGEPAHVRGTFASWHRCGVAGCSLDRRPRTPKSSNRGFFRRLPETRAAPRDCAELWPCVCEGRGGAADAKTSPCHSGSLQILPGWRTVVPNPHAHRRE